ncbi:NTSR1 [Mytilus coruscus]|uniref:NTSR1 n=1 Tax=Mytilus coruscus TaxID=42192 RepID=A0A6J8AWI9_MYTCO|nr:NTSR1 [Mytilus coruscus]
MKKKPRSAKKPKRKRKQNDLYYYTVGKSFGIILKCDEISKDTMSFAKSNLELGKPYKERKSIKNVFFKNNFHKTQKTDFTAQNMKNGSKVNAKNNEEFSLSNNRISKRSFSVEDISHTKVRKVTRFASAFNIPELSNQVEKGRNNPSCSFHSEPDESTVNIFDYNRKPKKTKMAAARRSHKYKMINTVLILIILSMIIGYLPEIVLNMIDIFTPSWMLHMQDTTRSFYQLFKRFYVITYITNPILYNLMDVEFVEHLRSIFQTCRREP